MAFKVAPTFVALLLPAAFAAACGPSSRIHDPMRQAHQDDRHQDDQIVRGPAGDAKPTLTLDADKKKDEQGRVLGQPGPTAKLRLLETTDLHVNMEAYDYYLDKPVLNTGFVRTATLVRKARAEVTNALLFDNGDLLQGTPLGDWANGHWVQAGKPKSELHTVFKALNLLGYDAANLGNHDFNYGLDFLEAALTGAKFPYVSANVLRVGGDASHPASYIAPYVILTRQIVTDDGHTDTIRIGVVGFVPPQIMSWDHNNLAGRVDAADIVDTAADVVPRIKAEGADLVVAIPHSGISAAPRGAKDENAVYYLAAVPGIDAILCGHSHQVFPSKTYANIPNADLDKGLLRGIPTVMAGFWGDHVGVVDLALKKTDGQWHVVSGKAEARTVQTSIKDTDFESDVRDAVAADHQATVAYLKEPVGVTTANIDSFFSELRPDPSVQLVQQAQLWYVKQALATGSLKPTVPNLPVLSASAPLNAGQNPGAYTNVPAGSVTLGSVAGLYIYPNTLQVVQVSGQTVLDWLEMAALHFNQVQPNSDAEQPLVNAATPAYNFEAILGLEYKIDVSQPPRFDATGKVIHPEAHRIVDVRVVDAAAGRVPLDLTAQFLVVTNNYRAGGGGRFPGLDGKETIYDLGLSNRDMLVQYVQRFAAQNQPITVDVQPHWSLVPVPGAKNVTFFSGTLAKDRLAEAGGLLAYVGEAPLGDRGVFQKFRVLWP